MSGETSGENEWHRQGPSAVTDDQLVLILDAFTNPAILKRLLSDMLAEGRITHDQAALAVYLRPELKCA
jgi:hypothetical protein